MEKHGLTVNFGVAKTEALLVLRGACKNKVKGKIKVKKTTVRAAVEQYKHMGSMCTPCGAMGPEVPGRVDSVLCGGGTFLCCGEAQPEVQRRMWLAKRLEGVQVRWTRKAVKRHRGEGCSGTDAQIRAEFSGGGAR